MDAKKTKDILAAIGEVRDAYGKLERLLSNGPASYYFERIGDCIDGLYSFAKFKADDAVALVRDIDCDDKPGWAGCEHFLKAGAPARVQEVEFRKGGFVYGVQFDEETWVDRDKIIRPVSSKHQFWFRESDIQVLSGR